MREIGRVPDPHRKGRHRRRIALLTAVSLVATLLGAPIASAAPVAVTDATLEWGISEEVQSAPPFGGCNYLSAGASVGNEASFLTTSGNVTILKNGAAPTWANKCDGAPQGQMNQKVVWSGGTGTVDPATGVATLTFTGQLSINFYGGLVPFYIENPVVTVAADGTGQIVATLGGFASSIDNPFEKEPMDPVSGIVVADLAGVGSANEDGFVTIPLYEGVEIEAPEGFSPQNRSTPGWGSWPESFVDFHFETGLSSYWYHSGGGTDPKKAPSAITISYGIDDDPGGGDDDIVAISGASFEWGFNNTIQNAWSGAVADGGANVACHFLSAGVSDGFEATYKTKDGNVTILKKDVEDGTVGQPTFVDRCLRDENLLINQKVRWSGGNGTLNRTTGAVTINFVGTLSINFNNHRTPVYITNPVLTVDEGGVGKLVATMGGYRGAQGSTERFLLDPVASVTVADLSDVSSANDTGFTVSPDFAGVEVTVVTNFLENPPPTGTFPTQAVKDARGVDANGVPLWGSFPETFVDFGYRTGLNSYFHSSSTASVNAGDINKFPLAITVLYEGDDTPPEPNEGEQVVTVVVPEGTDPGEFVWSIVGDPNVALTEAVNMGTYFHSTGEIAPIVVSDTRNGTPAWSLSGQLSDFTSGLSGGYLGWTPQVLSPGAGAVAGAAVPSSLISGPGLSVPAILAASPGGHDTGTATLGALLDLRLPIETAPGTYSAILTITVLH